MIGIFALITEATKQPEKEPPAPLPKIETCPRVQLPGWVSWYEDSPGKCGLVVDSPRFSVRLTARFIGRFEKALRVSTVPDLHDQGVFHLNSKDPSQRRGETLIPAGTAHYIILGVKRRTRVEKELRKLNWVKRALGDDWGGFGAKAWTVSVLPDQVVFKLEDAGGDVFSLSPEEMAQLNGDDVQLTLSLVPPG